MAYQPPIAGGPPPPYGIPGSSASIYNRYVPYDALTNSAGVAPPAPPAYLNNPPPPAGMGVFHPAAIRASSAPSIYLPPRADSQAGTNSPIAPQPPVQTPTRGVPSPIGTNSLLGNKVVPSAADILLPAVTRPGVDGGVASDERPKPMPIVNVFNPATDQVFITASSTSNSIL